MTKTRLTTELEQLDTIENEAQRMLDRLVDLREAIKSGRLAHQYQSRERGSFKRSTLDLGAMLSDYRQGKMTT